MRSLPRYKYHPFLIIMYMVILSHDIKICKLLVLCKKFLVDNVCIIYVYLNKVDVFLNGTDNTKKGG